MNQLKIVLLAIAALNVSYASDSLPDPKQVEIEQSAFLPRTDNEQTKRSLLYKAENGYSVKYDNLPENIKNTVALYSNKNIPRIEFRDANPRDVVGFLAKAGSPSRPIQLSGSFENKHIPDDWVMAIDDRGMKISCVLTNVNLLDLSIRVATVLSLEIGVLEDGNMVFGRSGQWLEEFTPTFTIGAKASEQ